LWMEAERALVFADVHLEKGSAYAARGQMLPPYDTLETLARLALEVEALAPKVVVLLGDALHDSEASTRLCDADAARIEALGRGRELVWVAGNHDPAGPGGLTGSAADDWRTAGLSLVHEPSPAPAVGEVAGHLHPCARVKGRGGSVRRRCFVTDGERLILPAFGAYAGGLNVRDEAFRPLFRHKPLAIALGRRAHPVGWAQLGGE
ncbi:MAG: ligase-associated DNA damage response endonuclease PdeM, partial [Caulobacteraceae bacterium]